MGSRTQWTGNRRNACKLTPFLRALTMTMPMTRTMTRTQTVVNSRNLSSVYPALGRGWLSAYDQQTLPTQCTSSRPALGSPENLPSQQVFVSASSPDANPRFHLFAYIIKQAWKATHGRCSLPVYRQIARAESKCSYHMTRPRGDRKDSKGHSGQVVEEAIG